MRAESRTLPQPCHRQAAPCPGYSPLARCRTEHGLSGMTPDMTKEKSMISLADQLRRIEQGTLTPEAALAESLTAIDAHEGTIKAFV